MQNDHGLVSGHESSLSGNMAAITIKPADALRFFAQNGTNLFLWHLEAGFLFTTLDETGTPIANESIQYSRDEVNEFIARQDTLGFVIAYEEDLLVGVDQIRLGGIIHDCAFLRTETKLILLTKEEAPKFVSQRFSAQSDLIIIYEDWSVSRDRLVMP
jgi:hypothetical protein